MTDNATVWKPLNTAPQDGSKIDILCKKWMCDTDSFIYSRRSDASWSKENKAWMWQGGNINWDGWRPVSWLPAPTLPTS